MATATTPFDDSDDDLPSLLADHRRELVAAEALDSDLDFAYHLQLQEAINASLSLLPSTSSSPPRQLQQHKETADDAASPSASALQSEEVMKLQQELSDRRLCKMEMRKVREDLDRRIHDQEVASEILRISERDWEEWGNNFEKPFGEGCSAGNNKGVDNNDAVFRLYFKGLVSEKSVVGGGKASLAGIGVTICDPRDHVVLEIKKPLTGDGRSKTAAETKALIEGLNAALALQLKRIVICCDNYPLYQFVIGRWPPKQRKIAKLIDQVSLLQRKFTSCNPTFVARKDVKHAFKLARDAIASQATRPVETSHGKTIKETCKICFEDTDVGQMFSVVGCQHRYCFSCMKQHVEVKLLQGVVPICPEEGCKSDLKVDSCKKFLTPKLIEKWSQRIREAFIPATEKIYCPYPKCSALMSRKEVFALKNGSHAGARKCLKCHELFCINCKVPWHSNMTCNQYKRLNPPAEDVKLKSLATRNLWRQCLKCNHMIELAEGCYHMTCRCGCEFCYNCGAEWKEKKPTCSCPLFEYDDISDDDISDDEGDEYYESDYSLESSDYSQESDDYLL